MRLHLIAEINEPVRDTANALGSLIAFTYGLGNTPERKALNVFLRHPSPRRWEQTAWIINSLIRRGGELKHSTTEMTKWSKLKTMTSPVVTSAVYDIEPRYLRGTPLQSGALTKQVRDKFKKAVGPQGFVSSLAFAGRLPVHKRRLMMKQTATNWPGLLKAATHDLPDVRLRKKF